jgi:hypothetical protein
VLVSGGVLAGVLAAEWVAAHAWEVLTVTAACGTLAVAAVVALMRWGDRREARHALERPFLIMRPAPVTATVTRQVTQGTAPAIEQHVHYHLGGGRETAPVITGKVLP